MPMTLELTQPSATDLESSYRRNYVKPAYDEYQDGPLARHPLLADRLENFSTQRLADRQLAAETRLREKGITFAVYGHSDGTEKVW
ncbi:MAG: hypothetical protein FJ267_10195, partial [Planctomycetes bacterium]|nr:hypothetical protein [Planctomycetota bacterium]